MTEPMLEQLTVRLERVERQLRWWRRIAILGVGGLGLVGVIGATITATPDEVRTRRLVISDGEGRGRAVLTVDDSDRTRLSLTDRTGEVSADLTVTTGQSSSLTVTTRKTEVQLVATAGTGQLSAAAESEKAWLVTTPEGSTLALSNDPIQVSVISNRAQGPSLQLRDREGKAVWKAP